MTDVFINAPSKNLIEVHDIDGNKKKVPINKLKLRVSVYGILTDKNRILLSWNPFISKYVLPGGAVELGETMDSALVREFKEETGLDIETTKLIDAKEDFFMMENKYAHAVLLIYKVKKVGGDVLNNGNGHDSEKLEYIKKSDSKMKKLAPIFSSVI